jgi:hypothetical protein
MSRWSWLKDRPKRHKTGSLEELYSDIDYCREREELAKLRSHIKTWRQRRAEAEEAVIERFGEEALQVRYGSSRAWSSKY